MIKPEGLVAGSILLTPTYGNWFDRTIGWAIRFGTGTRDQYGKYHDAKVNHAALYDGTELIEARPGGAGYNDWDAYDEKGTLWITPARLGQLQSDGSLVPLHLNAAQLQGVVDAANTMIGRDYGFADIVAVALGQKRLGSWVKVQKAKKDQPWWVRRVADNKHLICSQLVDLAFLMGGVHLFNDERLPGLVSPADLARLRLS